LYGWTAADTHFRVKRRLQPAGTLRGYISAIMQLFPLKMIESTKISANIQHSKDV
jgi:hypothetical protein